MKKIVAFFALLSMLVGCNKQQQVPEKITNLRFDIKVSHASDTKAIKQDFVEGDLIVVYFQDVSQKKYMKLTMLSDGTWDVTPIGWESDYSELSDGKKMYAIYFAYNYDPEYTVAESWAEDWAYPVEYRKGYEIAETKYKISIEGGNAVLSGTLEMSIPDGFVQFFIDKDDTKYFNSSYQLAIQGVHVVAVTGFNGSGFDVKEYEDYQPMNAIKYNVSGIGDGKSDGQGIVFHGKIDNTWSDKNNSHRLLLFDRVNPAKTAVIENLKLEGHAALKLSSTFMENLENAVSVPTKAETINYGGALWAPYNVGASAFNELGFKFAWCEIIPFSTNTSFNFKVSAENKYEDNYYGDKLYSTDDILMDQEDAARMFWGKDWRMPDWSEISELINNDNPEDPEDREYDSVNKCYKVEGVDINSDTAYLYFPFDDTVRPYGSYTYYLPKQYPPLVSPTASPFFRTFFLYYYNSTLDMTWLEDAIDVWYPGSVRPVYCGE